jgi:ABC-type branched-subunit amino acid transport system permease subunit
LALGAAFLAGLIILPQLVTNRYLVHLFIMTGMYIGLALSYDLLVGHLGLMSLAHPTFFGLGAYAAALLSTRLGTSFPIDFVAAGIIAASVAFLTSVPFFRMAAATFSIGTLGFALMMQLAANNCVSVTGGTLCLTGVPRPRVVIPALLHWEVDTPTEYYYLMLAILLMVVALCYRLTTSRMGRVLKSIREDEMLAKASGVDALKYKTFAFVIGALVSGCIGSFYVHYSSLICPTELSTYMTTILLIILFVGGVGGMRGVMLGGIVFTFLPEFLRIAYSLRMVIYGTILLVVIVYLPEGLDGLLMKWVRKLPSLGTEAGISDGQS